MRTNDECLLDVRCLGRTGDEDTERLGRRIDCFIGIVHIANETGAIKYHDDIDGEKQSCTVAQSR